MTITIMTTTTNFLPLNTGKTKILCDNKMED